MLQFALWVATTYSHQFDHCLTTRMIGIAYSFTIDAVTTGGGDTVRVPRSRIPIRRKCVEGYTNRPLKFASASSLLASQ
jgi:hypothetical protein